MRQQQGGMPFALPQDMWGHRMLHWLPDSVKTVMFDPDRNDAWKGMAKEVLLRRDSAIIGCSIEIIVSLGAIVLYDLRRSIVIPILNTGLAALSGIGLQGALTLTLWKIQVHGIITTGLMIAALLNFCCEALFTHAGMGSESLPGWFVLALLFIPYSLNLFCSFLSLLLQASLSDLLELEEQTSGLAEQGQIEEQVSQLTGTETCCVCMDRRKDAVFTTCGHKACCIVCAQQLHARGRSCPVCRKFIGGVVKVFDT